MSKKSGGNFSSIFPYIAIPVALIVGVLIYMYVLGNPDNFEGGDPHLDTPSMVTCTEPFTRADLSCHF